MTDNDSKLRQQQVQAVITALAQGTPSFRVVAGLKQQGWSEAEAGDLVRSLEARIEEYQDSPAVQGVRIANARARMLTGDLIAVAGIVASLVTYFLALSSPGGGHYLVAWGAIAFGGYRFFKGLSTYW